MKVVVICEKDISKSLIDFVNQIGGKGVFVDPDQAVSVSKVFLSNDEEVPGKSRFDDLFRVSFTQKQTEQFSASEISGLKEKDIDHLDIPIESYVDADVVVLDQLDLLGVIPKALNENVYSSEINYKTNDLFSHDVIYGNAKELGTFLSKNLAWDSEKEVIFKKFIENKIKIVLRDLPNKEEEIPILKDILKFYREFLIQTEEIYQKDLNTWEQLDIIEQRRTPRPMRKESDFQILFGCLCRSFDKLSDRDGLYLSFEERKYQKDKIIDAPMLRTFHSKSPLIFNGESAACHLRLRDKEKGLVTLDRGLEVSLAQEKLKISLEALFSPV